MGWRVGGTAVLLAVLLSACGSGHTEKLGPTADDKPVPRITTTTSATSATSTTVDIAAVPTKPDAAYAQRVMDELDAVMGDAVRTFVRDKGPSPAFLAYLRALYNGPVYDRALESWQRIAAQSFDNIKANPSRPVTRVKELLGSSPTCIYFTVARDMSGVFVTDYGTTGRPFVELLRKNPAGDPEGRNPTPWAMVAANTNPDGSIPPNPCHA